MRSAFRFAFVLTVSLPLALVLSTPALHAAELRVALTPPHDPDGLLWKIELRSVEPDTLLGEYGTAVDGTWSQRGLPPKSRINLIVKTDSRQPWWKRPEPIVLAEDVTEQKIALGLVKVAGTLTWGGGPISARLRFEDARVGTRMEVRADREGTFAVGLPRLGDWNVTVLGKRPTVNQTVRADVYEDRDGVVRTAIALESGCICGEVIDEDGKGVPGGIYIRVFGANREASEGDIEPETDGTFHAGRLPPGRYRVSADGRYLRTDAVEVELQPRLGAPWITLIARKESLIRGRLIDAAEQPVKEVTLRAIAPPGVLLGLERPDRTTNDGKFEIGVYPGLDERCVLIQPTSGRELVKLKVNVDDQVVTLQPAPSTLAPVHLPKAGPGTWLVRNGCAAQLFSLGVVPGDESGTFARLARGAWSICPGDFALLAKGIPFPGCSTVVVP